MYYRGRYVNVVDAQTGEVLSEGLPIMTARKKRIYTDTWMIMFQPALERMSDEESLTGSDFRVLTKLLSRAQMKNWVRVTQTALARDLRLSRVTVYRAFKRLCELGLLEQRYQEGSDVVDYRIPRSVAWRGTGFDYSVERARDRRAAAHDNAQ